MHSRLSLLTLFTAPLLALAQGGKETYDYVIVGGGTAGLTLAARLSEDPNKKVIVLEAGGTGIGNTNITDLRSRYLPYDTPVDWAIPTVPQDAANGRVYTHRQGKVLGGSSAINGAVYLRPDEKEFVTYEELGATGWSWENWLPYFKKHEKYTPDEAHPSPSTEAHGEDGPIEVSYAEGISSFFDDYAYPTAKNISEENLGDGDNSDGSTAGYNWQSISVYAGTYNRSYAANGYYWPNQQRSNLKVLTEALVSKITWGSDEQGEAVANGVEYITTNGTENVSAKAVVVSAGTLHTPKVLELSGIGERTVLQSINVNCKVENANVGNNLQNQLGVNVVYKLKQDANITLGSETQAPFMGLLSAQTVLSAEDLAKSTELLQEKNDGISQDQFDALKKFIDDGIAQTEMNWSLQNGTDGSVTLQFYTTDLHTFSRGYSHANSSDPQTPVTVNPKYLSSSHDLWYLSRAVAYTRNITSYEPLASIIDSEITPGANYTSSEDIQTWLQPNFRTMSHFVGTAAALPQDKGGVVDPETFRVYGTGNVYIADASIVPILPGIHTESIAYAIGERAADILAN